jgi:hypothetical protein
MRSPTSPFANVAHLIASGTPQPEWLIPNLERDSRLIRGRNPGRGDEDEDREWLAVVQGLERWLAQQLRIHPETSTASNLKHWKRYLMEVADDVDDEDPGS